MIEELVKYLVSQLVDDKDKITIESMPESEKIIIIQVRVAKEDMGKVIGKNGKIAQSIRTIVKGASSRENKRYIVKIDELN